MKRLIKVQWLPQRTGSFQCMLMKCLRITHEIVSPVTFLQGQTNLFKMFLLKIFKETETFFIQVVHSFQWMQEQQFPVNKSLITFLPANIIAQPSAKLSQQHSSLFSTISNFYIVIHIYHIYEAAKLRDCKFSFWTPLTFAFIY